jgi:hypothetical protein
MPRSPSYLFPSDFPNKNLYCALTHWGGCWVDLCPGFVVLKRNNPVVTRDVSTCFSFHYLCLQHWKEMEWQ